ncbi:MULTISPECIES: hypothetical protein [Streptomyces]|uniref:hypothetical protein n=1 Tax=Streptomyces TaxID=1883 RepID=UPI002ED4D73B|nr:hypothetical protein OG832_06265 [Streptomyces sp. NBC_00826]WTH94319.1 hypothetical protein OIC43_37425 [Streptomyces sp. NBC_00825]WTI03054.1 hypothetical protein OHA23_37405 [Streptomyces sp. NBC_00822]
MAPRTRNPGSEWLASCAPDPVLVHRKWVADELAFIPSGRLWLAVEADIMPTVAAMQRIGPDRLGPVLVYPCADRAWWLVPPGAEEVLDDLSRLTVHPERWQLRCPPAERYIDGYGWLEKPDGSGKLTSATVLGAAFGPGGGPRLPAGAFG